MALAPNRISPARLIGAAEICCGPNWESQEYHLGTAPIGTNQLITPDQLAILHRDGTTGDELVKLGLATKKGEGYMLHADILLYEAHAAKTCLHDRPAPMRAGR